MSPLIVVRDVSKTYRRGPEEVHALRGVSFELRPGEVVGLFGPSGSGKSTLLNVLCGWEHPDEGEVTWEGGGAPPIDRPWAEIAIIPQTLGLVEELSVRENVELPARLARRPAQEREHRVDALLGYMGLADLASRSPSEVSLGEQQRAALARALVLKPRLLLADEPSGHQDADWAKAVFRAIHAAASGGTTCLVATHTPEAEPFLDRRLAIRDGVVHETGVARRSASGEEVEEPEEDRTGRWRS
jgi:ABC-type lipoprotein export system ATPase subunit